MKRINAFFFLCFSACIHSFSPYDLTILGHIKYRESLARLPISLANLFKDELNINFIRTPGPYDFTEVSQEVAHILQNRDKTPGNVAILFDELWRLSTTPADRVPKKSFIKVAYSMIEGTAIPQQWVTILNRKFDLVLVPDEYYQGVYQQCGVTIPIFVLAHGIDLEDFLAEKIKTKPSKTFTFGSSGMLIERKNQRLLIQAFHEEFGNDPSVRLHIHGRTSWEFECEMKAIYEILQGKKPAPCPLAEKTGSKGLKRGTHNLTHNIQIIHKPFSKKEYIQFLKSLDCYVLVSKGEGFSLTPREALALAKPCIISDNTAHKTIGKTGHVYAVPSQIDEPSLQSGMGGYIGFDFNCKVEDVRKALREVYIHYHTYQAKALEGRAWVRQYCWENRKALFLNVIKPQQVILGDRNEITAEYIMTNSLKLYEKYTKLRDYHVKKIRSP